MQRAKKCFCKTMSSHVYLDFTQVRARVTISFLVLALGQIEIIKVSLRSTCLEA